MILRVIPIQTKYLKALSSCIMHIYIYTHVLAYTYTYTLSTGTSPLTSPPFFFNLPIFLLTPFLSIYSFENSPSIHTTLLQKFTLPLLLLLICLYIHISTIYIFPSISCYFIVLRLNSRFSNTLYIHWHFHFPYYIHTYMPAYVKNETYKFLLLPSFTSLDSVVHLEFILL